MSIISFDGNPFSYSRVQWCNETQRLTYFGYDRKTVIQFSTHLDTSSLPVRYEAVWVGAGKKEVADVMTREIRVYNVPRQIDYWLAVMANGSVHRVQIREDLPLTDLDRPRPGESSGGGNDDVQEVVDPSPLNSMILYIMTLLSGYFQA